MKFKYSLQSILNFKKELEDLARGHLGEIISEFNNKSVAVQNQVQKRATWMAKWQEKKQAGH